MKGNNKELAKKYFYDAIRYFRNAIETLKKVKVDPVYKTYIDTKHVAEACGMGYLAMVKSIEGYLISRGVKKLPISYDGLRHTLSQHLVHNGKLQSAISFAYETLHILGYYRYRYGSNVKLIKEGVESAKFVIEKLTGNKV